MKTQSYKRSNFKNNPEVYVLTYRQEDLSWRCIVFLPFNFAWRMLMAVFGCIYFSMVIFEEVFMKDSYTNMQMKSCDNILSLITTCHLIDLVLSLLHRTWGPVQKSMPHQPKAIFLLFLDLVGILPIRLVMTKPIISKAKTVDWMHVMNLNGCLRVYRIFIELIGLQQKMWLNPVLVCIVQQNALILSLVSVLCSLWYAIGYVKQQNPLSWLDDLENATIEVDLKQPVDMYLFSFLHVYVLLCNELVADVRPLNHLETYFVIATLYAGAVLRYSYVIGNMIHSYLKYQGHMYKIKDYMVINKRCLMGRKEKQITEYYITFWNNWMGLHKCPVLDSFPLCLKKDILTDVYWDALEHSHVLRHFPDNIKRQISLVMKSKFMEPGDHIFRKGEIRNRYYYIASGVVQIMSHYDGVSPIMTISSGSCLGALSLLLPSPCPTDVICATVCEVRYLTFRDFHTCLEEFMNGTEIAKKVEGDHIQYSKRMYVLSKAHKNEDPVMKLYGVPQDDKLKWIKKRWRIIHSLDGLVGSYTEPYINKIQRQLLQPDVSHTSKYLDVIVLSSEMKWDSDTCCLRTSCPYTLEPTCDFVKVWLAFVVLVITIDCMWVPYCAAFLHYTPDILVHWDHIVFFCYAIDIYLQTITAVKLVDKMIVEPMHLLRYHLSNVLFIIDLLSTLPIREISRLFVPELKISPFLALPRMFKIVRVFSFFKSKYNNIAARSIITHVVKYVYTIFFTAYFAGCFFFILACTFYQDTMVCISNSWYILLVNDTLLENQMTNTTVTLITQITDNMTLSVYRILKFVTSCGLTCVPLQRFFDILYVTFLLFISRNMLLFIYSELVAMYIMRRQRRLLYIDLKKSLKVVLTMKNVHPGLITMLETYMELQWRMNYAIDLNIQSDSTEIVSPILNTERQQIISDALKRIQFFRQLDTETFQRVVKSFRIFRVPKDYIFCRAGELPTSFNVILKGICNLTSMFKEDLLQNPDGKLIGPGAHFPLLEAINSIGCLQTTISATVCKLITIDTNALKIALRQSNENLDIMIARVANFKEAELDIIISKKKYKKVMKTTPNFILCRRNRKRISSGIFSRKLAFLLYWINRPFMIHPHGRFMFIWESLKFIQIILTLIYLPAAYTLTCSHTQLKYLFAFLLDSFSLADVCIRFYLGHYNKDGVLVLESDYYLSHSFTVDLVSSLPIYLFVNNYDFNIKLMVTCTIKSLQIYRLSGFLMAAKRKFHITKFTMLLILFSIHIILITMLLGYINFVNFCKAICLTSGALEYSCDFTWLSNSVYYAHNRSPIHLVLYCINLILYVILGNDQGAYTATTLEEMRYIMILICVACVAKCYYIPKAVSYLVGGAHSFTKHRDNHRLFWLFINNEGGSKEIAKRIYNYFVFDFVRMKGIDMNKLLESLHPALQYDLTFAMYYKAMRCLHLFVGADKTFMKLISNKITEVYYQNDTPVIIVNGANDKIYFVCEGYINIYNSENEKIKILGPGSMFGSFKRRGLKRHRLKFMSKFHSNLLMVSSVEFLQVLKVYNEDNLKNFLRVTKYKEYIEFLDDSDTYIINELGYEDVQHPVILHQSAAAYKWIMFFLSMIVPYLTAFPVMFCIAVSRYAVNVQLYVMIYILDVLSLLRIYFGLNATYIDQLTGMFVSNLRYIRCSYIMRPSGFLLDFISLFPFEVIGYFFTGKFMNLLLLNRLLRLLIMINYIASYREKTYVRIWLRWFEFISLVSLPLYFFACLWMYVTCENVCSVFHNEKAVHMVDPYDKLLSSLDQIVCLFTFSTSYELTKPWTPKECIMIILYNTLGFVLVPMITAKFIQTSTMSNYNKRSYEYNIYCMKIYLQLRDLSKSLLDKLWNYSLLLYKTNQGHDLPPYIENSPMLLRADLFSDLYGDHLKYNILFEECNSELIYQLSALLRRTVYFPGDFIIRKMDVDNRMYFINSGEVDELEFDDMNTEVIKTVYITGHCFGLAQGLYERTPHFNNYKARTMVEILTLQKSDWLYLIEIFPDDFKTVFKMARKISLEALL